MLLPLDPVVHVPCDMLHIVQESDCSAMQCRWVENAGGSVSAPEGIEVSPLVSYGGEGLAELCSGKSFQQCLDTSLQVCHIKSHLPRLVWHRHVSCME